MYQFGGVFTAKSREGLARYQEFNKGFRAIYPKAKRAEVSAAWAIHKRTLAAQKAEPKFQGFTDEDVKELELEFETDPLALHKELLMISQANPNCYPYGIPPSKQRDLATLKATVRRARG